MNIVDFLKGQFIYPFSDINIKAFLIKRGVDENSEYDQVSEKQLDLLMADLYDSMCTIFSQGSSSVTKGEWTKTVGGITITNADKRLFRQTANNLYAKHGEPTKYSGKDMTNAW